MNYREHFEVEKVSPFYSFSFYYSFSFFSFLNESLIFKPDGVIEDGRREGEGPATKLK